MLFFLGIGSGEFFLIAVVALIFFGTGSSVKLARTLGRFFYKINSSVEDIKKDLEDPIKEDDFKPSGIEKDVDKQENYSSPYNLDKKNKKKNEL